MCMASLLQAGGQAVAFTLTFFAYKVCVYFSEHLFLAYALAFLVSGTGLGLELSHILYVQQ